MLYPNENSFVSHPRKIRMNNACLIRIKLDFTTVLKLFDILHKIETLCDTQLSNCRALADPVPPLNSFAAPEPKF